MQEMLAERSLERSSRIMHPSLAISETTHVADALHFWADGYANVVVKTNDGRYRFISQTDLLRALLGEGKDLAGITDLSFTKLGITHKVLYGVKRSDRALQAFRLMSDRSMHAVPVTEEEGGLVGEISLASLRLLRPDNFHALMGTVGQFIDVLGVREAPLIVDKDASVSNRAFLVFCLRAQLR